MIISRHYLFTQGTILTKAMHVIKSFSLSILLLTPFMGLSSQISAQELSDGLNGTTITYTYTGGWKFTAKYTEDGVSYRMHNYNTDWTKPYPYKAFLIDKNVYFTSWYDTGRDEYVTHLIDLNKKRLHGSVLLGKEKVHFESAEINEIKH